MIKFQYEKIQAFAIFSCLVCAKKKMKTIIIWNVYAQLLKGFNIWLYCI